MASSGMRPVVYLTSGIFGYLYRFFPIGNALLERGHRVVVVTPSAVAAEHASAAGFEVSHLVGDEAAEGDLPLSRWTGPLRPFARRVPGISLGPRSAARRHWRQRATALSDTTEVVDVLDALDPGLVLTEAEEHRYIRVALTQELDLMLFEDLYSVRPGPDVPFPGTSHQVPSGTWWSRRVAAASWARFFLTERVRRRAERWWVDGFDWHSTLGDLGAQAGLSSDDVSRRYFQYYDYQGVPRLRTTLAELAFPGEPQPPLIVGPVIDPSRVVFDTDEDVERRWAESLRRQQDGARIIYVTVGTFLAGVGDLTEQIIEAAQRIGDVEVVVSVGQDRDRWRDVAVPDNVSIFGRVPQTQMLPSVDVVVSTGGLNTGQEALWFGVPVLNLPGAGLDPAGNSARLAYHGVGRRLTPRRTNVDTIHDELVRLLGDPSYRERAARFSEILRRANGAANAADAIEEYLGRGRPNGG